MITFNGTTPEAYYDIMNTLYNEPLTSSRTGATREILNVAVVSPDPRERYLVRDDSWNLAFQLQEHFAYWQGLNPGHVDRYVDMSQWLDDEEKLPGSAYGDRLRNTAGHDQIARAIDQLRDNPESRRAVMQVHQAAEEMYFGEDVSCTESLQVFMRDGKLHMTAIIRSQDMYWGYAYDAANNQFLQELIAGILQCDVGTYTHVMNSCHYYEEFANEVDKSCDSYSAESTPDMRRSATELTHTMSRMHDGLTKARDGQIPTRILRFLAHPYDDWVRTMTAYEMYRFHDSPTAARHLVNDIDITWWKQWVEARMS